jgi:hypothetical protein
LERRPFALPYPTWQKALLRVGKHIVSVSSQFGKANAARLTATALRQKARLNFLLDCISKMKSPAPLSQNRARSLAREG